MLREENRGGLLSMAGRQKWWGRADEKFLRTLGRAVCRV